jgi:predicted nucleic acid-binding protein
MVLFQWVALPPDRLHGTDRAVADGRAVQCLSPELAGEFAGLLARPAIREKSPHLTSERISAFIDILRQRSRWLEPVPAVFTFPPHPKDDHLFNLAIGTQAHYLVTWERRLLELALAHPQYAAELKVLAPGLQIVTPPELIKAIAR